jgi:hypothetical protein
MRGVVARGVVLAVAVALVGCGGAQSPAEQARSVVQRLYTDLASGNGKEVCSLLTTQARQEIVRVGYEVLPSAHLPHALDCSGFVTAVKAFVHPGAAELKRISVGRATATNGTATVIVTEADGSEGHLSLVRTPNGWRISDVTPH